MDLINTLNPVAFTEDRAMSIQDIPSKIDRLITLAESVIKDTEPGRWMEVTQLMKFARSRNGSIVMAVAQGRGFAYYVKGPEMAA